MEERYKLLFQKADEAVVDSFATWGIVCAHVPFSAGGKTKSLPKRSWSDEHGEDVYTPAQLMMDAYDAEFEMAYKGQELASNPFNLNLAFLQINSFVRWLTGNDQSSPGTSLKIYSPYSTIGRQGCYLLEVGSEEPHVQVKDEGGNLYNENVVTFKVKFRVTDPLTNITLTNG